MSGRDLKAAREAANKAREAKTGVQTGGEFVEAQVLKDVELIRKGIVDHVEWHFFRNPSSGKLQVSEKLLDYLIEHDIPYVIHH